VTDLSGKNIAIIATDFVEEPELVRPRDQLRDAGARVWVYSPEGESIQAAEGDVNPTQKIPVEGSLADIDLDTLDALVVPGGTVNADHLRMDSTAQKLVRDVLDAHKTVASICHGPWLLVSAEVVEGRRLTSWPSLRDDIRNAGGEWVDEEVVVDNGLITSRKPDDIPAFVDAIRKALGGADDDSDDEGSDDEGSGDEGSDDASSDGESSDGDRSDEASSGSDGS
jgi:protease I